MNQIMSFKSFLIEKVMSGTKDLTTRLETDYRLKLDVGDTIYIYTGIRTKAAKKHGEAVIVNRWKWRQMDLLDMITTEFWTREGFNSQQECFDYFTQKQYIDKHLITYEFKLKPKQPTLEGFIQ